MRIRHKNTMRAVSLFAASALAITPIMASGWQHNDKGWWYGTNNDNSAWHKGGWKWVDGNNDGIAECYYFDANGYILSNTTTPDGYTVNSDGAWVKDGKTQTMQMAQNGTWQQGTGANAGRWQWINSDGSVRPMGWHWLDGNRDGVAECYYIGADGWLIANGKTPDGYTVNADGAWIENHIPKTKNLNGLGPGSGTIATGTASVGGGGGGGGGGSSSGGGGGSSSGGSSSNNSSTIIIHPNYSGNWNDGSYTQANSFKNGNYDMMSSSEREAVADAIEDFKDKYNIDSLNDFEKEIKIIGWLVENCSYKSDRTTWDYSTAYSAIVNKQAQCAGYADAFLQMAKACGLEVRYITGVNHAWNIIKLDGEWYHVDVTWEDPIISSAATPYTMKNMRNRYINITDSQIKERDNYTKAHSSWSNSSQFKATSTKYGPVSVGYYLLTGDARAVSDDELRLYCMDHDIELGSHGGSDLYDLGYKLDSGENYFKDVKNDTTRFIAYMRSRFDQKKDVYIVVPNNYDMKWLTKTWVNETLNSTGFGAELPNVNGIYGVYKIAGNYSCYRIKYQKGYKTEAELNADAKKIREMLAAQGGAVTSTAKSSEIISEHLANYDESFYIVYDETTVRDTYKYNNLSLKSSDAISKFTESNQTLKVDGVKYRLATYSVKYMTTQEWLKYVFDQYATTDKLNIFTDSFDANDDGVSFDKVYESAINSTTLKADIPIIYADDMDTDVLKEKIIAAYEAAGKTVNEATYYFHTRMHETLKGKVYTSAYMTLSLLVDRDAALDAIDDKYKVDGDANVFIFTNKNDTVDEIYNYFDPLVVSADVQTSFYYILDSDSKSCDLSYGLNNRFFDNYGKTLNVSFFSNIQDYIVYDDGYLIVYKVTKFAPNAAYSALTPEAAKEAEEKAAKIANAISISNNSNAADNEKQEADAQTTTTSNEKQDENTKNDVVEAQNSDDTPEEQSDNEPEEQQDEKQDAKEDKKEDTSKDSEESQKTEDSDTAKAE